jgi:hypothetical protein
MERKTKKRVAIVMAVGGGALAMGGVYATLLGVTANQTAGGSKTIASCTDTVNITSGAPTYSTGGMAYYVDTLTVSGVPSGCANQTLYLANQSDGQAGAAPLFTYSSLLTSGSASMTSKGTTSFGAVTWDGTGVVEFTFAPPVPVASIGQNYAIAIRE